MTSRPVVLSQFKDNKQGSRWNLLGCHGFLLKRYKRHSQWVMKNSLFLFWILLHQFIPNFGVIIYSILLLENWWLLHPSTRWLISSLKYSLDQSLFLILLPWITDYTTWDDKQTGSFSCTSVLTLRFCFQSFEEFSFCIAQEHEG